jgi:hypothetical protein
MSTTKETKSKLSDEHDMYGLLNFVQKFKTRSGHEVNLFTETICCFVGTVSFSKHLSHYVKWDRRGLAQAVFKSGIDCYANPELDIVGFWSEEYSLQPDENH